MNAINQRGSSLKMCSRIIRHFTLKNFFSLICTVLTLVMVGQELNTFSIERPTTVSTEEGDIKKADLPEVVICTEPGLDLEEHDKYGYERDVYYRGSHDGKKFVGWNGVNNEKPSQEILEEVLRIKNTSLIWLDDQDGGFSEDLSLFVAANISVRKLMYPHGSCLSINPSDSVRFRYKSQMTLHFELNSNEIVRLLPKDVFEEHPLCFFCICKRNESPARHITALVSVSFVFPTGLGFREHWSNI